MFKKQISNPEVEESVNIYPFIFMRKIIENYAKRHGSQHITYSPAVAEEMAVITVVAMRAMKKYHRPVYKPSDYVTIAWMVVVMPVKPVRVRMITIIIIYPARKIPAVIFPVMIPVVIAAVIVIPVIIRPMIPVVLMFRIITWRPVIFTSFIIPACGIPAIVFIQLVYGFCLCAGSAVHPGRSIR